MSIYYSVGFGLQGCYLDDSKGGVYQIKSRKELCEMIRNEIAVYDLPKNSFKQANVARIWPHLKKHGALQATIYLRHKHHVLTFYGLTEDEFNEQNTED